jgi:hypothetical protein
VLADGKVVGRIYEQGSVGEPPDLRWFWSITSIVPATPGRDERHRRDARGGDGEVSRRLGQGKGDGYMNGPPPARIISRSKLDGGPRRFVSRSMNRSFYRSIRPTL